MSVTSLEGRVRDQLGFYPSYLSALEPTPDAAELVWAETERVLAVPWAARRGEWLGSAVTATIEDHLPRSVAVRLDRVTFDEPELQQTVEFFAFVLLRLGVGISAARYVLDGEGTRPAHRERDRPSRPSGRERPASDLPRQPRDPAGDPLPGDATRRRLNA